MFLQCVTFSGIIQENSTPGGIGKMKLKVICWLLACAIFISAAALPMDAYATNSETMDTQATEPTTETEATEATTEASTPT